MPEPVCGVLLAEVLIKLVLYGGKSVDRVCNVFP